jgi:hypothetical protein
MKAGWIREGAVGEIYKPGKKLRWISDVGEMRKNAKCQAMSNIFKWVCCMIHSIIYYARI